MLYEFNKVAGALASCDHQKSKLLAGAEGFSVAELQVRQLKIGRNSCFGMETERKKIISCNFTRFCHCRIKNDSKN